MELTTKTTINAFLWKYFERFGSQLISFIVQIILARILSPSDFGALAIILVFINLSNIIVQSGMNTALIQSEIIERIDCSTVFCTSLLISIILYLILFIISPLLALYYSNAILKQSLRIMGIVLFVNALNGVQVAIASRNLNFKVIFKATLIASLSSGIIAILCAIMGLGIWSLIIQQLLTQSINCFVLFRYITWKPKFEFSMESFNRLFGYGWKLLLSNILGTLYMELSNLIVGKIFGNHLLGVYSQSRRIPQLLVASIDNAIQSVTLSALSRINSDLDRCKSYMQKSLQLSSYIIAPLMFFVIVDSSNLVIVLLTEKWADIVPYMQVFCIAYSFCVMQTCNLQAINALGFSNVYLKLELSKDSIGLALLLVALFIFNDMIMIVISFLMYYVIAIIINSIPNKKMLNYGLSEQFKDVLPSYLIAIVSMAPAALINLLISNHFISLLLVAVVYFVVYICLSVIIKPKPYLTIKSTIEIFTNKSI